MKLEVFELNGNGHPHLVFSEKFPARLGSQAFLTHKLKPENVDLAIEALKQIRTLSQELKCEHTVAVATAAVRECDHEEFVERAKCEAGIEITVIPGIEEARLVYSGVRAHTELDEKPYLFNDIGGGSTELLVCNNTDIHFVESLRLGTVRLKEMFAAESKELVKLIDKYVERSLEPYIDDIRRFNPEAALSTGGTARTILEIMREMGFAVKERLRLPLVETKDLARMVDDIAQMSKKEIVKLKSVDENRRDIILPGAALLLALLKHTKLSQFMVSPNGLRDGALADFVFNKVDNTIYLHSQRQFRETGLEAIVEKYKMDRGHSEHVANLSVRLFDLFAELHKLAATARDLLKAAAILHDIGKFIDYSQHHKHALYILTNTHLPGYTDEERAVIAHTARYHRKSNPKASHLEYQALAGPVKETILKLSAILRIADSLDRSYSSSITKLDAQKKDEKHWLLSLQSNSETQLERWAFQRKKDTFEKVFNVSLDLV